MLYLHRTCDHGMVFLSHTNNTGSGTHALFCPLLREYRGDLLDLTHMGYVCVVDADSNVLCHAGGADETVFYRSAPKPLQALPAIARGWTSASG